MVPACAAGNQLDVKKSSYKKLSKFLEQKEKYGYLNIKELSKGVENIMSINYEHEKIQSFKPTKQLFSESEELETTVLPCDMKYEPPSIVELFNVTSNVLKLFKTADIGKGLWSSNRSW